MEHPQSFRFQQARNISETLNATFAFIRQEFKPLGKAILYMVGPFVLITSYFSAFYFNGLFQAAMQSDGPEGIFHMLQSPYYWITVALQMLGYIVNMLVVTYYVHLYIQNDSKTPSVNLVWISAINDLPRIFMYLVVMYLVIFVGTLAFIIPGLYLSIGLSLFIIIAIHEKPDMINSMLRSLKLIKGYWWFTLGIIILASLLAYLLQMLVQIPFALMGVAAGLNMEGAPTAETMMNASSIMAIVLNLGTLFYAILFVAQNVHYFSQLEKKDASGLQKQIKGMEDV